MRRPRGLAEWTIGIVAATVGLSVASPLYIFEHEAQDRRSQNCAAHQAAWDNDVDVLNQVGIELGASSTRIHLADRHFAKKHPRPIC